LASQTPRFGSIDKFSQNYAASFIFFCEIFFGFWRDRCNALCNFLYLRRVHMLHDPWVIHRGF